MLISCKCLNFIATSSSPHHPHHPLLHKSASTNAAVLTADAPTGLSAAVSLSTLNDGDCSMSSHDAGGNNVSSSSSSISTALMHVFLQRYPRNFVFYSQCMDFFKQLIGPIPDLTIEAINQRDLMYSLTLDISQPDGPQSWQISICINCNAALCAKRMQAGNATPSISPPQFLINASLMTTNDEVTHRRADKSFSDTFGLLIMDHPELSIQNGGAPAAHPNYTISSITGGGASAILDSKQLRLRQLQQHLQQRLKREIAETDERIQRYTEQQFALLKSFREKSEQEYALLVQLIQRVPEQAGDWLDRAPPALEASGGVSYVARRRNTITSRTPLLPTTPTITNLPVASNALSLQTGTSAIESSSNTQSAAAFSTTNANTNTVASNANRKMSSFDTPPATPEATPMSVGNSPTFRQQQQQQQQLPQPFVRFSTQQSFQQQFPTPTADPSDDCLFELEGVESGGTRVNSGQTQMPTWSINLLQQQQQQQLQRAANNNLDMSDLDESGAEEAEDALDMDSSMPIPLNMSRRRTSTIKMFGKSLPIEIASSPMAERSYLTGTVDDELDNNVDIAASIKALAKSVHGEAVFGDLPRPRLRSQI